jgi:hypothetical protein
MSSERPCALLGLGGTYRPVYISAAMVVRDPRTLRTRPVSRRAAPFFSVLVPRGTTCCVVEILPWGLMTTVVKIVIGSGIESAMSRSIRGTACRNHTNSKSPTLRAERRCLEGTAAATAQLVASWSTWPEVDVQSDGPDEQRRTRRFPASRNRLTAPASTSGTHEWRRTGRVFGKALCHSCP